MSVAVQDERQSVSSQESTTTVQNILCARTILFIYIYRSGISCAVCSQGSHFEDENIKLLRKKQTSWTRSEVKMFGDDSLVAVTIYMCDTKKSELFTHVK